MKRWRLACTSVLFAAMLPMAAATAAPKNELDQHMAYDGLVRINVKGVDLVYARPGASLAGYRFIKLDPVEVAFRKDWDPARTGSRIKLTPQERESIRAGVAKVVYDEFVTELHSRGGYKVVQEAEAEVLRVKIQIVNLYVNAPNTGGAGRSKTYQLSAGEMTLVAELYDSESGEILARVADRREARNTGRMELSSSVVNAAEAADMASGWARILRKSIDRAREAGRK